MSGLLVLLSSLTSVYGLTTEELSLFTPRIADFVDHNTGEIAEVWARDNGDGSQTIYSNGVPSHETWLFPHDDSGNPNELKAVETTFIINATPVMRDEPLWCLPEETIGIATSGTAIWGWYPAEDNCPDVTEFEELDICEGHPGPPTTGNQYHYHYYSPCVQMQVCGEPSPLYGVALDGIPIYGPFDENGVQLTRSDLDECGGRYDSDGRYKYHMTADPDYSISCFMGEIRSDSGKSIDTFRCVCPYTDAPYETKPSDWSNTPVICSEGSSASDPIVCDPGNLTELAASFEYKWEYVETETTLVPCCPSGEDCGYSCKDETGIKSVCQQETKVIKKLTRMLKSESSGADRCGSSGMVVVVMVVAALRCVIGDVLG